jgi:hypothetical protein
MVYWGTCYVIVVVNTKQIQSNISSDPMVPWVLWYRLCTCQEVNGWTFGEHLFK